MSSPSADDHYNPRSRVSPATISLILIANITLQPSFSFGQAPRFPTNAADFTKTVAELLQRQIPDVPIAVRGPLSLGAKSGDGQSLQINLDRIWQLCQRTPDRCSDSASQYISGTSQAIRDLTRPIDRSMIRVALRPAAYLVSAQQQLGAGAANLVMRPFIGELSIVAVIDLTRSLRLMSRQDLQRLGLTDQEAIDAGLRNVSSALPPLATVVKPLKEQSIAVLDGDEYQSSRMLLHDDWTDVATALDGDLIVAIPAPNVLLYTRGKSRTDVDALRIFARDVAKKSDRPLSNSIFKWTPAGWDTAQ